MKEHRKWKEFTSDTNYKRLWDKSDWKGNIHCQVTQSPAFEDLAEYFENIYNNNQEDLQKIEELNSNVYIPVLDDPICNIEIELAIFICYQP